MANTYDPATDAGHVRLLLNDVSAPWIFSDTEINAFLSMARDQNPKRAAALAIDTNASNEALASKVLKSQDVQTDGAKVADALRKHAAALRDEANDDDDSDGFITIVDTVNRGPGYPYDRSYRPELSGW